MFDPAKMAVIINLEVPRSVKQLRAMLGHMGYYRKFIKSYAQITTPMKKLLKKDATLCWNEECQRSLDVLKEKMVIVPILVFPAWKKEFHVHMDASCIALGAVLTQAGEGELDHPILFASRKLFKVEKNYSMTEREGLVMVYTLQKFRHYFLGKHFKMYTNHFALRYHTLPNDRDGSKRVYKSKKELVVRAEEFSIIVGYLYKMGSDEILRCYVPNFEHNNILAEAHGGVVEGNYVGKEITQNILRAGLWWPTLHKDYKAYCKACDACQRSGMPSWRDELPLNPQVLLQPFEKWAIDFAGPIQPPGKKKVVWYIIIETKYLTGWAEVQPVKDCTRETIVKFLFEYVLARFDCPNILMSDHGTHFLNETISALTEDFQVYD
eukprot:PITA_12726